LEIRNGLLSAEQTLDPSSLLYRDLLPDQTKVRDHFARADVEATNPRPLGSLDRLRGHLREPEVRHDLAAGAQAETRQLHALRSPAPQYLLHHLLLSLLTRHLRHITEHAGLQQRHGPLGIGKHLEQRHSWKRCGRPWSLPYLGERIERA